jgi:hypothetical protein
VLHFNIVQLKLKSFKTFLINPNDFIEGRRRLTEYYSDRGAE